MARGWWVALGVLAIALPARAQAPDPLAPRLDPGDVAPEVEPPSARGIDERCAEGAQALWRGEIDEAVRLGREAIARAGGAPPSGSVRHALARCHALVGRALLARGSRDPAVHASADAELRRAWSLEPSADLVDDLVTAHWLGAGGAPLPVAAHALDRATPAERAALAGRTGMVARTLRTTPTAGGPTWSVIGLAREGRAHDEIVAVACARAGCVADPLFAAWTSEGDRGVRALARLAVVGFVPIEPSPGSGGLALVVAADHAIEGEGARRTSWDGSTLAVRWVRGGAIEGWSLLTRSRLRAWDRGLGDGPPTRVDVQVRWGRRRVVVRPSGRLAHLRLGDVAGLRDPRALACERCWLGALRPGHLFLPGP